MKIRPVLKQQSVISMAVALGSTLFPGCDQKLGGDVPMTPEMQKKWQEAEREQGTVGAPLPEYSPEMATPESPSIEIDMNKLPQSPTEEVSTESPESTEE